MQKGRQSFGSKDRRRDPASLVGLGLGLLALLALAFLPASAVAAPGRHAAMVIDANSGQVLHAQGADEPRYPASLTKMMTVYIVFELLQQGRLKPNTRIRISPTAASTSPSKLGLEAGAEITVMNAVQALIVKSANDMAVAVAEHIAGSEPKFAALMTQKARQLGMSQTTFRNAHGLPDSGQVTTARDMLTLAMRLHDDFPQQYRMFSQRSFAYGGSIHRNHNTMLDSYRGMDGLKTGYTTPSGFNLVASVRRDGKHVVAAVFGGSSAAARNAYMRVMLDRTLPNAATTKTRQPALVARTPAPKLVEPVRPVTVAQAPPAPRPAAPPRLTVAPLAPPAPEAQLVVAAKPEEAPPPGPESNFGAPVEVARVRPVVVAPRPRRTPEPVVAQGGSVAAPIAQPPLAAAPPSPPPAAPIARGVQPSSLQAQAERLKRGEPPAPAPVLVTGPAPARGQPVPGNRQQPTASTAALEPAQPNYRLKGPTPAAPSGAIIIQIGAYSTEAEAQRQLQAAKAKAGAALATATPTTVPVTTGGRQLFRARFVGFDAATAATACNELRRQQIDCQVAAGG
ncbi:MAG: serine hydrolase [Hyphomicrobiaceae bacterium]